MTQPAEPAAATPRGASASFIWTRMGSLLAILPLGVWTLNHLWDNLSAFSGKRAWEAAVEDHPHPVAHWLTLLVVLLTVGTATGHSALVVQVATEPPGLDLTASPASAIAAVVFYNVQECLVKVDRHGKLVPWLAERWHTADEKNYTFFLKRGVRFHNGRELKAADVKFAVERAMNPETKHPYPQFYAAITNIVVKDDYTITVTLKSANAAFLYNMARQGSVI